MTQVFSAVQGIDFVLPAPPGLVDPPLTLLDEARVLLDLEGLIFERQRAVDTAASAILQLSDLTEPAVPDAAQIEDQEALEDANRAHQAAMDAYEDARSSLEQLRQQAEGTIASLDTQIKRVQRWEHGFQYLPELPFDSGTEVWQPDAQTGGAYVEKASGSNQPLFLWYDPFIVDHRDSRSAFGWPYSSHDERIRRAERGLRAHESKGAENEFWTGLKVPTNFHLTASPHTATGSAHRTIDAWDDPTPSPGTFLGVAVGLTQALASLDQAIATSEAGTGMVHLTPFLSQYLFKTFPFLRNDDGFVRTVNGNIIVPGYGYPGTGPDQANRTPTDVALTSGSNVMTSATAAFTVYDLGREVTDTAGAIPAGTVILVITSATEVMLSANATSAETNDHVTISGTGGDASGCLQQWAYATEMVHHLRGDVMKYPYDPREQSPNLPVDDLIEVRAERTHALITNQFLRAAVLVDTQTP